MKSTWDFFSRMMRFSCWSGFQREKQMDGKTAEDLASSDHHEHIVDLLEKLKKDNHKLSYIQQLRPTQTVQPRIKLKLFGHSGAGKSTLLESLKCGILRSFFRRRRTTRITNAARHPNSPINSKPADLNIFSLKKTSCLKCFWARHLKFSWAMVTRYL
ncbi:Death-associated protein kinase 1 [Ilyodon furcidens]|uniref:Death-associated protein kinase 1 n=1 Tax=Ilyodon furcidens TaxID=33524 RepID=A0ABV0T031_9TELE